MLTAQKIRNADALIQSRKVAERALLVLKYNYDFAAAIADGTPQEIVRVQRAAVAGATTADHDALVELKTQAEGFFATLASVGLFDAIAAESQRGELHMATGSAVSDPVVGHTPEGRAIRITSAQFQQKIMRGQDVAGAIVISNELVKRSSALAMLDRLLLIAISRATDARAVHQLVAGAPTVAASGHASTSILFDLRRALDAIPSGSDSRFRVGVSPKLAKRLTLATTTIGSRAFPEMSPTGGVLGGLACSVSESLSDDVTVTDASGIATASTALEFERATSASLEMSSTPTQAAADGGSPDGPIESNVVSLFQVGATALKVSRTFDWTPLRAVHTVVITGAGTLWGTDGGSPPA